MLGARAATEGPLQARKEVHRQKKSEHQHNQAGPIGPVCESPCLNYHVGTFGRWGGQLVAKKQREKKKKKTKNNLFN
jgi:hypothetical protein